MTSVDDSHGLRRRLRTKGRMDRVGRSLYAVCAAGEEWHALSATRRRHRTVTQPVRRGDSGCTGSARSVGRVSAQGISSKSTLDPVCLTHQGHGRTPALTHRLSPLSTHCGLDDWTACAHSQHSYRPRHLTLASSSSNVSPSSNVKPSLGNELSSCVRVAVIGYGSVQ